MATSLLYLGLCLGPYSILVTASSGGVCNCCSCYGCCKVAGAAIKVTSGTAIGTTYSTAVKIAGGIGRTASGIGGGSYRACWRDRACADGACVDKAYADGACADKAYTDGACADRAYADRACVDRAYMDEACGYPLLEFP